MKCKKCERDFHYCTSCDYDLYMSDGYCSRTCFEATEEYYLFERNLKKLWSSLDHGQKIELWAQWDNGIFEDEKYSDMVDSIIKHPDDE